jgi:hypothetical protein
MQKSNLYLVARLRFQGPTYAVVIPKKDVRDQRVYVKSALFLYETRLLL